ncbi:HEPN domain-containing protein [Burkholderia oklahomensis]|uniref:HEPN domain-containing protein n=1 Tax=Burkholderia oklahomensis TaxID=342113 RepID=UPI0004742741|nr:HEPN domain-containing protein [Burkholderia oklahomensis]AOI44472.1 hypothetical protein WI23_00825 [Burkholderia oklahomensis C6786]KUY61517.1 hypothetical protein WI23_10005 [Burkholderia oklahomensis C6786]MBI0359534.1 hypothetical protein [Burkholderia oklahomensis]
MTAQTAVDRMFAEAAEVMKTVNAAGDISLISAAADHFRKALLLGSASYFEQQICVCVLAFVHEQSGGCPLVGQFVKNKAVERQYHTWFDWKQSNANQFFGLFGPGFKDAMKVRIGASDELKESIAAFLEVGGERNKLVHQDYATFQLEKTMNEIYDLYKKALTFVEGLPSYLREAASAPAAEMIA